MGEHESTVNLFRSDAQVPTAVLEIAVSVRFLFSKISFFSKNLHKAIQTDYLGLFSLS